MKYKLLCSGVLLVGIFISSVSQVLLKKASQKKYESRIKEYANPLVIMAYFMYFATSFLTVIAYRGIPLSMGSILGATSYIYVTIFGVKLFGEKINRRKVLALLMIISGIVIYSVFS